jgi:hypothetical protein
LRPASKSDKGREDAEGDDDDALARVTAGGVAVALVLMREGLDMGELDGMETTKRGIGDHHGRGRTMRSSQPVRGGRSARATTRLDFQLPCPRVMSSRSSQTTQERIATVSYCIVDEEHDVFLVPSLYIKRQTFARESNVSSNDIE